MTYFDEDAEYWGDRRSKIINHNRLTARSVKIFADGEDFIFLLTAVSYISALGALRSGHAAVSLFLLFFTNVPKLCTYPAF